MLRKPFTRDEDKVIIQEIKLSPTNLQAALLKAAFRLNRTKYSVEHRYYKYLRKGSSHLFLLFSPKRLARNCKNTWSGKKYSKSTVRPIRDKWKAILDILFD